jgi:hypothetical protein
MIGVIVASAACQQVLEKWRKRVGVEPTGDRIACRPPVLKTGTITGPHALPKMVESLISPGFWPHLPPTPAE